MGTRQTRLLSPTPAALTALAGRLVQLVLTDGEVVRGVLAVVAGIVEVRPSARGPAREVAFAAIRELITDLDANR